MKAKNCQHGISSIIIDKEFYYPGEDVRGNVFLKMNADFFLSQMEITLEGIEMLRDSMLTKSTGKVRRVLYQYVIQLGEGYQTKLGVNYHVFPFRVNLPLNIPGSCRIEEKNTKVKVSHKLTCRIHIKQNEGDMKQSNQQKQDPNLLIITKEIVNVREMLEVKPPEASRAEIFKSIYSWFGCWNEGVCRLICCLDRQFYISGESGVLSLLVQNDSAVAIASFSVSLWIVLNVQELQKDKGEHSQNNNQINREVMRSVMNEKVFAGVRAKSGEISFDLPFQFVNFNSRLPLSPSVQGTFTLIYYFVEVGAHFEGCSIPPLVLQLPLSVVLTSKELPRTIEQIQTGDLSKQALKRQSDEVLLEEFDENVNLIVNHPLASFETHHGYPNTDFNNTSLNHSKNMLRNSTSQVKDAKNQQHPRMSSQHLQDFPRMSYKQQEIFQSQHANLDHPDQVLHKTENSLIFPAKRIDIPSHIFV